MTRRRGARFRAVSPDGRRLTFRRSLGAAVRDAVYEVKGWNKPAGGIRLSISCDIAMAWAEDVVAAGWTFEVLR